MTGRPKELTKEELTALRDNAEKILFELVTPEGIYGSSDMGWRGSYHSWFGRDSAITADFLCYAMNIGGSRALVETAKDALVAFSVWQGKADDIETGEERGKLPHEIRNSFNEIDRIQHTKNTNEKPWFIDPKDGLLKNWDSVDSTSLWVSSVIRVHKALKEQVDEVTLESIRLALEWLVRTIHTFGGFVGFIGADEMKGRVYSGLHNQGWKDSFQIYQNPDGSLARHPIKDVLVNAEAWQALMLGCELFHSRDESFSRELGVVAETLKRRFNDAQAGFLLPSKEYYAQAIDGDGHQLPQFSADVAMCLWAAERGECVIVPSMVEAVAKEITSSHFLNPSAGIRNYSINTEFSQGTKYHGSPQTYWPFVSGLVAIGLDQFGYKEKAEEVIESYLHAVHQLGSNIEMFVENEKGGLAVWHHPNVGQESVAEQAWSAAAVYFGSLYLLRKRD